MTGSGARVIVGRYRLVRLLGRGGMGAVWQAHDTLLGRDVAIKEIWFPGAGTEPVPPADPLVRRALREAQAAARLHHPGIVTVHDVVTDDGRPWIVMELINGRSLAEAIREHGLLTEQKTAEIGLRVLDALRTAHREGIAHRDVKPANILLDAADRVVLTDFGIAAVDDATALTATGQMVGSPAYLAPERINGRPAAPAADLWALGVTLYTAVTGSSPFQRDDTQATIAAVLTSRPTPPAHAGRLWPVIKGLLVKEPDRRLTAEQAHKLLANVAYPTGSPGSATPTTGRRLPRWRPGRPGPRRRTVDGLPGTVAAPAPTIAAPTAHQQASIPGEAATEQVVTASPEPTTTVAHPLTSGAAPAASRRHFVLYAAIVAIVAGVVGAGTLYARNRPDAPGTRPAAGPAALTAAASTASGSASVSPVPRGLADRAPRRSTSPPAPRSRVPAAFHGRWVGIADQPMSRAKSWPAVITFAPGSDTGKFEAVSLRCKGVLTVTAPAPTERVLHVHQRTTRASPARCAEAADLTLIVNAAGGIDMYWQDAAAANNTATATLVAEAPR
ncbi:serine/threonine-protein kinase [Actinoplanes sp. NPDC049599]|uniref:serine/threonine-protein kinase n=1 Tax=Actinoplanes sp. NPDC049599 TaxID=3363903 RepID=UPI0037B5A84D